MSEFVVFGVDVLDAPAVGTTSGAGNEGQGTVTITGGSQPFEDDDIIVFEAVRLTPEGEIGPSGAISDITVYDSRADYEAGIVKYNYEPMNPNQTANVQNDLSGLGDGYVSINSNVLVPVDGGPSINRLFIAPRTNLADAAQEPGGLTLDRNQDFDFNGDGDFDDPVEDGNNKFYVGDYTTPLPCFTVGTRILTPSGERQIEDLKPGDRVITYDNGAQPIRWIGRRRMPAQGRFVPVVIAAGRFGDHGRLVLSQNHRILLRDPQLQVLFSTAEMLISAKHLVDNGSVTLKPGGWVDYVHILFDRHQLIWANGLLSESLYPGSVHSDPGQHESLSELIAVFPELAPHRAHDIQSARRCLSRYEAALLSG